MTAKLKSSRLREEVANFAGYCMGSSYGDWDPRVDAIQEQVLEGGGGVFVLSAAVASALQAETVLSRRPSSTKKTRAGAPGD